MSPKLAIATQKAPAAKAAAPRLKVEEKLTAVIRKCPQGYAGYVEEIPGTNSHGATLEETKENLAEAVQLILRTQRELSAKRIAEEKHEVIRETLGKACM